MHNAEAEAPLIRAACLQELKAHAADIITLQEAGSARVQVDEDSQSALVYIRCRRMHLTTGSGSRFMLCRHFDGVWPEHRKTQIAWVLRDQRPGLQEAGYEGVFQQKKRDSSLHSTTASTSCPWVACSTYRSVRTQSSTEGSTRRKAGGQTC